MRWSEYTESARRLAHARDREAARSAQVRQRAAAFRTEVDRLRQSLNAQREHLTGLAQRLREPRPSFGTAARTGLNDAEEALRRARTAMHQADVEARGAEERGTRPALFPAMSPTGRNVLVYSMAAMCTWSVSCGLFTLTPVDGATTGALLWSTCGLPAVAYFAAYLVITVFGRPRGQAPGDVERSVGLGGLICFGGSSLAWALVLAVTALR